MKAYKGFDKNMQCRGFQYEEGKTYELPNGEEVKLCESGFHACEAPLDCFGYYPPGNSVFHEVDLDATDEVSGDDSKRVGSKITIGVKLDVAGIVKAQFEYTKERCTNEKQGADYSALNGGNGSALNGGNWSALNGGDVSALNGGDWSALNGGYGSVIRGGIGSKFKGGKWAVFACEVRDSYYNQTGMVTAVVDGETIKADTWYTVENGKFVEVEDDDRS